ncbi:hypothetical protein ACJW30_03G044500 [Castanea mollissima]
MGVSPGVPSGEPIKKKRGRPRKYGPDGPVSLQLSPMSAAPNVTPGSNSSSQKRARGRPPGTGRKQILADLGEWMNNSAGMAFAPHVITIGVGECSAKKSNIDLMVSDFQSLISELSLVGFVVGCPFDRRRSTPDAVQVKLFNDDSCKTALHVLG